MNLQVKVIRVFDLVAKAHKSAMKVLKSGNKLKKVYDIISDIMDTGGYKKEKCINFRVGHGYGFESC